jgi:hypothetical protein
MQLIVQQSIARWVAAGSSASPLAQPANSQAAAGGLSAGQSGPESPESPAAIVAGIGGIVGPTSGAAQELAADTATAPLQPLDPRAVDQIDLSSAVEDELGSAAGLMDPLLV